MSSSTKGTHKNIYHSRKSIHLNTRLSTDTLLLQLQTSLATSAQLSHFLAIYLQYTLEHILAEPNNVDSAPSENCTKSCTICLYNICADVLFRTTEENSRCITNTCPLRRKSLSSVTRVRQIHRPRRCQPSSRRQNAREI